MGQSHNVLQEETLWQLLVDVLQGMVEDETRPLLVAAALLAREPRRVEVDLRHVFDVPLLFVVVHDTRLVDRLEDLAAEGVVVADELRPHSLAQTQLVQC